MEIDRRERNLIYLWIALNKQLEKFLHNEDESEIAIADGWGLNYAAC